MSQELLAKLPDKLREKVEQITKVLPHSVDIFDELYKFALNEADDNGKRKVQKLDNNPTSVVHVEVLEENIIFNLQDVTVLSPLRKKLNLVLHLSTRTKKPVLSLIKDSRIEMTIEDLNKNVRMATVLPVPEKLNLFYIFISFNHSVDNTYTEPILATINKNTILENFKQLGLVDSDVEDFTKCIEFIRKQAILTGFRISDPFFNVNSEQAISFHVEGHRGTKEGTLYFLPDHIIFGFKKPILLFDSADIESITYSSITRLTFNVTLVTKEGEKFEFSMIDQTEYGKIDEYVKRKQLKDRSMSEELKAKTSNKNQAAQDQVSSLQEAAQQLADGANINNINMDTDDEEGDMNFEGESDLSDGSDDDNDDDDVEDNDDDDDDDDDDDEPEVDENNDEDNDEDNDELEHNYEKMEERAEDIESNISPQEGFQIDLGLDDIPIEIDDEEDNDDDDDDENSGVEYD